MADSRRVTTMIVIGVACVACVGVIVLQQTASDHPVGSNATEHSVDLPQLQSSRYLNTGLDAKLIGTNKCAKCHAQQFESYSQTRHSAAMALVQPATEPASQEFQHQATARHYSVYRNDNGLYHR